ncbi:glycosyltransferase family 9 protein [Dokdonia sp. Hel_I_53]|uniref:glycosyltransferase family 9 protein n=1 Tax=Dokdonia sp. Hel_I_53 TaxID=1566287 RepID=UPI00119A5D6C|nr:glycosyltransferase family 9 protein [Dokdonia sp. Hel_I_53]TVZ52677.1 lipopolysaccharide heptosyltransferase II [Dokdonia sp. Hel_I_53]
MHNNSDHILVIRLSAMGDVAMIAPVVYALAKKYPHLKISVLSKSFFKPIVETIPGVHFVTAEVKTTHKGVSGIWKLSRDLKKQKITHIADLHNVLRSKMLLKFMATPAVQLDKGRTEKKALISGEKKHFKQLKNTITRYADVFEKLGYAIPSPIALPRPQRKDAVAKFTKKCRRKWLGIAPFAAHLGKQYPLNLMKEVIRKLDESGEWDLFLFGSPSEVDTLKDLCFSHVDVHIAAGALSFSEQINLIAHLDAMISMDSGNGHLAAMFGVPTVTLWGVTHPYAGFTPFAQEKNCILSDRTLFPEIPTSIFGNTLPDGYEEVMRTITPEMIVEKISSLS